MAVEPIEEILEWSKKLSGWKQDCLRRLATCNELTEEDLSELLAMIKKSAGLEVEAQALAPQPFTKSHFGGGKQEPVILKGIRNVKNVNRLVDNASLTFCPKALTIVYGRNGSGKSGFVRILRTACRTRVENPSRLKVLADVYGGSGGPQTAEVIVDAGAGDVPIAWTTGMPASSQLLQIGVFDTASAQLYVDGGNQIRYLPFGLALPHRLNSACLTLKERLEAERAMAVGHKVSLTTIGFPTIRNTSAQLFNRELSKDTTVAKIDEFACFDSNHQTLLDEVQNILSAGSAASADLSALITWIDAIASECECASTALSDTTLSELANLRKSAIAAREAANLAAGELFKDEPLQGVGSESWRRLWAAARDYSVNEAYPGEEFPVTAVNGSSAECVLCQQKLLVDATARMNRFQKYMDDMLDIAATKAEKAVSDAKENIPELLILRGADFGARLEQVRMRDIKLADKLSAFQASVTERRAEAFARLASDSNSPLPQLGSPHLDLNKVGKKLKEEKNALDNAAHTEERTKLLKEAAELEDRKILAANHSKLVARRALFVADACYARALAEVHTRGITQRANELIDTHLTSAVVDRFDAERKRLDIVHLKVGLTRKSGQTKAEFEVDPKTKFTNVTSDILSEGEQRALALAGFLTEVALTDGSGPIVVDDPVSSLDRDRSSKVAERLAEEACERQVVVFTHDIVFFNELCRAAEEMCLEPVTIAVFGDQNAAGKIDPAGMVWKGLNVAKRITRLKADFAPLAKLYATSPADYELQVKNFYGRLRDTYERAVEEVIFRDIVRRGSDVIHTQLLRYVTLSDALAIRFHVGMTRANTHSHDNPAADTVAVPAPSQFLADVAALEKLVEDLKADHVVAEAARPQMKPKKS